MLKILLVEDDHLQCSYIRQALADSLDAIVATKTCEWEFQRDFEAIAADPPDVAVLDIMLRWASPSRGGNEPPTETPYHAGLRCARKLAADTRTQGVKIVLYSVLPKEEFADTMLPDHAMFVVKEPDCQNLIDKVKEVFTAPASS